MFRSPEGLVVMETNNNYRNMKVQDRNYLRVGALLQCSIQVENFPLVFYRRLV